MDTIDFRLIASRSLILTIFLIVVAIATPSPLSAQRVTQPQDLGPTDSSQIVTASLVLKVKHSNLLEAYVASTEEPDSASYHRFLSLRSSAASSLTSRPVPPTFLFLLNI